MHPQTSDLCELPRIPILRTQVNKGYVFRGRSLRVACGPSELYATPYYGKRVEAQKPVPQLGTSWDEWSQWRNRLPPKIGRGLRVWA
jgi:hypothetical protein